MNRSEMMSRIRSKWTHPEVEFLVEHCGDETLVIHPDWLPFKPDFILNGKPVFIDGDFWHCFGKINFGRLSEFWQSKLVKNLSRDLSRDVFYEQATLSIASPQEGLKSRRGK